MSLTKEVIEQALEKLDHTNDGHWLENGLPNPAVVHEFVGSPTDPILDENFAGWIAWANPTFVRVKPEEKPPVETPVFQTEELPHCDTVVVEDTRTPFQKSEDAVRAAEVAVVDAQNTLLRLIAEHDVLILAEESKPPTDAIRDYLESRKQILSDRAEAIKQYVEKGGVINNRSPLDSALANRARQS